MACYGTVNYTLCWDCAKATDPEACPWVGRFEPVPNWWAKETIINNTGTKTPSYLVIRCALFERDADNHGLKEYGR